MKKIIIAAIITFMGYTCIYGQTPAKNKADSLLERRDGIEPAQQPGDTMYHPRKDSIIPTKPGASIIKARQGGAPEGAPRKPNTATGTKAEAIKKENVDD